MLHFNYLNKKHTAVNDWAEITIAKAAEVMEVVNEFPEALKKLYDLSGRPNMEKEYDKLDKTISDKERYKLIPELYGKIIVLLSDVGENEIKMWSHLERTAFYNEYMFRFVYAFLIAPVDYQAENITSFDHRGKKYYMPHTREIMGNEKPFADVTAMEFAEVADLEIAAKQLKGGRYEVAATIVAILCREYGDGYDEAEALERAKEFEDLPMSIVWEVFFYTLRLSTLSKQRALIYLLEDTLKEQKAAAI